MNNKLLPLLAIGMLVVFKNCAQGQTNSFQPMVFWESNMGKGIILVAPAEILIVDSKGDKHGKVIAKDIINSAYLSPDGKKITYATMSELWLVDLDTKKNRLVATGFCDYLRWSADSSSFFFAIGELQKSPPSLVSNIKFFWADGDGKNLKQVYP